MSSPSPLDLFHPVVREWFERRFGEPTEVQAAAWPVVAANSEGGNTLVTAPTGAGKTLAAFLLCLDRLLRAAVAGTLPDTAQVVYVSPLKALSNDIHKNLSAPLGEITRLARERGLDVPDIRIALRTGDTPAHERQAYSRRPPHVWVTTPESLYILLTSVGGRRGLAGAHTLILDEIHAVAGTKRGAHLSLSAERLARLAPGPLARIGLSATIRPLDEVARFLAGAASGGRDGACAIVDAGGVGCRRDIDLQVETPDMELSAVASLELWDATVTRIAHLCGGHGTTLVFVGTRRLAERVAHQLSEKLGELGIDAGHVAAHHGSLAHAARMRTEARLKRGELRVCVATASLELGIDIGAVDLVCQIGSPRSIGVLLQRVGRSGHRLGGMPKGRVFPLTRDELVECAALLLAVRRGELDRVHIPEWPLDVLAQQVVAMCAAEEGGCGGAWRLDELFESVRRAHPYRDLPRGRFDAVVKMLSEGFAPSLGRGGAYLHLDAVNGVVRARRGARLAAVTCGGAIPDSSDYDVVNEVDGARVGSVYEDFVFESMAGDVFLLGNASWRIRRVEKGRLLVEDAHGQAPDVPFWVGEAPARTAELSRFVSEVRRGIDLRLPDGGAAAWLAGEAGLSAAAAEQACAYIAAGRRVLGAVPSDAHVVAERFFDEAGGTQLVVHAPFGARVNRALALLLRRRIAAGAGEGGDGLQASATDDGCNISLTPRHSFPMEGLLGFLGAEGVEEALVGAVLSAPLFRTRWRWTLTRSLALRRFSGGRRVPPPLLRMRADDLLGAVLPEGASACRATASFDHPLLFETLRDCFREAMSVEGLSRVLEDVRDEGVRFSAVESSAPSAFAHQMLNAMPYAFLDNAPLEERRARAVSLRRALPDDAAELGRLDPDAVRAAADAAWPVVRDAEELHDALFGWLLLPEAQMRRLPPAAATWMADLERDGRASLLRRGGGRYWAAVERLGEASRLEGGGDGDATLALVRGWVETCGPFRAEAFAAMLGFPAAAVQEALGRLEAEGAVLRGRFTPEGADGEEFCDRRILARIHRATVARLRREVEPVPPAAFLRFLFQWQHLAPGGNLEGAAGALEVVRQLQGYEAAAAAWEPEIIAPRIKAYAPEFLDDLCAGGEVVWGRWRRRETLAGRPARRPGLARGAPVGLGLRGDLAWLLDGAPPPVDAAQLAPAAREVLEFLRVRGASFFQEVVAGVRRLPSEAEDALWQLVSAGLVTADAFTALRALYSGETRRIARPRRGRPRPVRRTREGRWALLAAPLPGDGAAGGDMGAGAAPRRTELWARQLLHRYGVFCRELLAREQAAPPWRLLLPALRRLEARGEVRGGRFVSGLYGEQFASPDAVAALRAERGGASGGDVGAGASRAAYVRVSACDPLNLAGVVTPGQRVAALAGNRVVYRDGVPVAAVENGEERFFLAPDALAAMDGRERAALARLLDPRPL
ncbi:MAG: DEAD/DEAH box helicase [Acidobacteriota bacterium]|jgi:ATP-dependent Lhr-like helicase|nr:DEAD/DEAH box helicase [Acidobacteriota bacterium]